MSKMVSVVEMVAAVRAMAVANYEKDGWDYVVEAWDDAEIAEVVAGCRSVSGAVAKMKKEVSGYHAYAEDIKATAF